MPRNVNVTLADTATDQLTVIQNNLARLRDGRRVNQATALEWILKHAPTPTRNTANEV